MIGTKEEPSRLRFENHGEKKVDFMDCRLFVDIENNRIGVRGPKEDNMNWTVPLSQVKELIERSRK